MFLLDFEYFLRFSVTRHDAKQRYPQVPAASLPPAEPRSVDGIHHHDPPVSLRGEHLLRAQAHQAAAEPAFFNIRISCIHRNSLVTSIIWSSCSCHFHNTKT